MMRAAMIYGWRSDGGKKSSGTEGRMERKHKRG